MSLPKSMVRRVLTWPWMSRTRLATTLAAALRVRAEYVGGAEYTIADMAIWPWYGGMAKGVLYEAGEFLDVASYRHVNRWADQIAARPAVKRGRMVNRTFGEPSSQLRERHEASDFETKTQDKVEG